MRKAFHWLFGWLHRNGHEAEILKKGSKEAWTKAQSNVLQVGESFKKLSSCEDRVGRDVCENRNQA